MSLDEEDEFLEEESADQDTVVTMPPLRRTGRDRIGSGWGF